MENRENDNKYEMVWRDDTLFKNMFPVRLNGKYGYIDINGNEICDVKYDMVYGFSDNKNFSKVELNGEHFYIDRNGNEYKLIIQDNRLYKNIGGINKEYIEFEKDKYYKIFNKNLSLRDVQYEVGKTYKLKGKLKRQRIRFEYFNKINSIKNHDFDFRFCEVYPICGSAIRKFDDYYDTNMIKIVRELEWIKC